MVLSQVFSKSFSTIASETSNQLCQYQAHLVGKLPYSAGLVDNYPNADYRVELQHDAPTDVKAASAPTNNERSLASPLGRSKP
jgi:hypothetical protein